MAEDSIVYTVNLIIGLILAGVMSRHWRLEVGGRALQSWIVAAWILTLADLLFVLRSEYPLVVPRLLPTLFVTAGHAKLLLAAQFSRGTSPSHRLMFGVFALHAVIVAATYVIPGVSGWRTVSNGVVWGGLSFVAALTLLRGDAALRRVMFVPAIVLAAQGAFHAIRTALATQVAIRPDTGTGALIQLLGNLEVSLFMVALFVSVLVSFLQRSNEELRAALADVRQLSSMLPLCSWCHKVRDDDGYWTRIEEYLAEHRVNVTHGLCEGCAVKHFDSTAPQVSTDGTPASP